MPKRFTDTDIWKNQRWFRKLTPNHKLSFCYIKDACNHAGLWKIDCSDLIDDLLLNEFDLDNFIKCVNTEFNSINGDKIIKERLRIVKKNYLWITGFVQFQYEGKDKVVCLSSPVRTALMFLQSIDLLNESINKGFITLKEPLQEGWQTPKDRDKDRDKKKGGSGENKILQGERFDEDFSYVYFPDGTKQKLGNDQKDLAKKGYTKPQMVIQGAIY